DTPLVLDRVELFLELLVGVHEPSVLALRREAGRADAAQLLRRVVDDFLQLVDVVVEDLRVRRRAERVRRDVEVVADARDSLLVLVLPAYFDLPLRTALLATLVGGLIGNAMLATAGLIGADGRVPTMVLQRAPLGRRGSYLATALNILQCLGWAIFELIVIATAAGLLCDKLFGFRAIWFWKLLFGGVAAGLALLGPIGFG